MEIFHEGEIAAQLKAGERTLGERNGRVITNKIIKGAINFIEKQPFCIISSSDSSGVISVSALAGDEGYVKVKNEETLEIYPGLIFSNPFDLFWENIKLNKKIGLLFIELATRRRFRINGTIAFEEGKIVVAVDQAYPNCPKYIQKREALKLVKPSYYPEQLSGSALSPGVTGIIQKADTLFVGSSSSTGDMDASHRGGLPGFVRVKDENTLIIPDYLGNSMYNTLGNFEVNPNAALLFIDFKNKQNLQLSGTAEVVWNNEEASDEINTGGTNRFWIFKVKRWVLSENLKGMDWKLEEYSPFNPS